VFLMANQWIRRLARSHGGCPTIIGVPAANHGRRTAFQKRSSMKTPIICLATLLAARPPLLVQRSSKRLYLPSMALCRKVSRA